MSYAPLIRRNEKPHSRMRSVAPRARTASHAPTNATEWFRPDVDRNLASAGATVEAPSAGSSEDSGSCPLDKSVRFITSNVEASYSGRPELTISDSDVTMAAKRFDASAMVRTVEGLPADLDHWQVGLHQTIDATSNIYACYSTPEPNRDPRGEVSTGMVFHDFSKDPGGPVLDGSFGQDTPPFYNASDSAPMPGRAIRVSMNDTPHTSAPLFWDRDAAHGACLTKLTNVFEASAFVIAMSSDSEVCYLAHIHWGFVQSFDPGTIALDASGNPDVGNYSMNFGEFNITTGVRTGGHPSETSPPFANVFGANPTAAHLAPPCPATGPGCIRRPW